MLFSHRHTRFPSFYLSAQSPVAPRGTKQSYLKAEFAAVGHQGPSALKWRTSCFHMVINQTLSCYLIKQAAGREIARSVLSRSVTSLHTRMRKENTSSCHFVPLFADGGCCCFIFLVLFFIFFPQTDFNFDQARQKILLLR